MELRVGLLLGKTLVRWDVRLPLIIILFLPLAANLLILSLIAS